LTRYRRVTIVRVSLVWVTGIALQYDTR
jgi:hypothetical protein